MRKLRLHRLFENTTTLQFADHILREAIKGAKEDERLMNKLATCLEDSVSDFPNNNHRERAKFWIAKWYERGAKR